MVTVIAALALFAILMLRLELDVLLAWVLAWTPVGLLLYVYDKFQSRHDRLRVPEINLLAVAALGGFGGAIAAMLLVRHKTRKPIFWVVNALSAAAYGILLFGRFV